MILIKNVMAVAVALGFENVHAYIIKPLKNNCILLFCN